MGMLMRKINWDELAVPGLTGGKKTALTIGVFDGLHRGHRLLIEKIIAKAPDLLPAVVTFRKNPKPLNSLQKDIVSFEEKMALLAGFGTALCVIIDFSEQFSKISGRVFLETLNRYLCPAYIALGANFHCGYRRDTDAEGFSAIAKTLGIETEIAPPVLEGGLPISSSRIRAALEAGRIEEAALFLGRPIT